MHTTKQQDAEAGMFAAQTALVHMHAMLLTLRCATVEASEAAVCSAHHMHSRQYEPEHTQLLVRH
jgi:hypothetical protein